MLYALLAVFIILLMLYLMPIAISVAVKKDNENDIINIGVNTLYGLLKLKTEVPLLEITLKNGRLALKYRAEVPNRKRSKLLAGFTKFFSVSEGEGLYKIYKKNRNKIISPLKYILRKIKVYDLNLRLGLGTGDAAVTAILNGMAWIAIGSLIAFTSSYMSIKKPRIAVVPIFSEVKLSTDFSCIISMRLGHIINAGIRAIPALLSVIGRERSD
ncbi:MAG TPA: DUF2953 domain-containing protein [Clostridia bacterium]|nr:DUF2953 domain-containing protein [Clostridia bacterium]